MNKEDYFKYYIQGSDHYLIPKDVFKELFNEMMNWKEESKGLNQKYLNAVANYETTMSELQELKKENKILKENAEHNDKVVDKVNWENMLLKKENKQLNGTIQTYDILLKSNIEENQQLKIQISARETLCEEYEQLINTILNFDFFKEECPLNFSFEDNSKEDEAQNIFYNDEYCENNCNDNYKDCWLKYFKKLQKAKGDVKNEN